MHSDGKDTKTERQTYYTLIITSNTPRQVLAWHHLIKLGEVIRNATHEPKTPMNVLSIL
jgi:hypothetical protein